MNITKMLQNQLETLLEIIQREQESVLQLLDFSHQKQNCLMEGRDAEISALLKLEGAVVGEISEKEQQRKVQVGTIAKCLGDLTDEASLREITDAIEDEQWKKRLSDARDQLTSLIERLKLENQKTNTLLRQKLKYTDMMLDLVLVPDTMINVSYDTKGKRETADVVRSGFLDVYI